MHSTEEILVASRARVEASHARILRSTISDYDTRRMIELSLQRVNQSWALLGGVIERSNAGSALMLAPFRAAPESTRPGAVCNGRQRTLRNSSQDVTGHYKPGERLVPLATVGPAEEFTVAKDDSFIAIRVHADECGRVPDKSLSVTE
jgi:hypothetical protein